MLFETRRVDKPIVVPPLYELLPVMVRIPAAPLVVRIIPPAPLISPPRVILPFPRVVTVLVVVRATFMFIVWVMGASGLPVKLMPPDSVIAVPERVKAPAF